MLMNTLTSPQWNRSTTAGNQPLTGRKKDSERKMCKLEIKTVQTETAKDEERICKEKSVI